MPDDLEVARLKANLMLVTRVLAAVVRDNGDTLPLSAGVLETADAAGLEIGPTQPDGFLVLRYNPEWMNG